jgi:hypothetical protein
VRRPPLPVVAVAVFIIALGETGGALLSPFRPQVARYAQARVSANPQTHGLIGSVEYDDEVVSRAVFSTEAGLSFFHTHAEGVGLVLLFAATLVASVVRWRLTRALLYVLLCVGGLFPLGYLAYALAVLELGRETGVEVAERYVLSPLGGSMIAGLLGVIIVLVVALRASGNPRTSAR